MRRYIGHFLWYAPLLAMLYFLWELATYRGLFARAAEWQLYWFDRYMPILTFQLLSCLFGIPILLFFVGLWRSRRGRSAEPDDAIEFADRFRRFLALCAWTLAMGAIVSLLVSLVLPGGSGPPRELVLDTPSAISPPQGPTRLVGATAFGRTAIFRQNLVLGTYETRYAPVLPPSGSHRGIQYFVELVRDEFSPTGWSTPGHGSQTGVLVRSGLPGAITKLYEYVGYGVESPTYVLYASPTTRRMPYFMAALGFALCGLAFLAAALFQARRVKRLRRGSSYPAVAPQS